MRGLGRCGNGPLAGPALVARVKSFSPKSGWGFVELAVPAPSGGPGVRDVFFHRSDVAKSPPASAALSSAPLPIPDHSPGALNW